MAIQIKNKRLQLPIKSVFERRWFIHKVLGEGAYGGVYEVEDVTRKGLMFALKVESNACDVSDSVKLLPLEVNVLRALRLIKAKHYPGYEYCGQTAKLNYVVMGLVGKNINNVRKDLPGCRFRAPSVLHISSISLLSLAEIHKAGYLHRDMKPANMCIGRPPNDLRSVYILDYGMCRRYLNEKGQLYSARRKTGFRGTPWYASDNAMHCKDQGRVDDVWSWFLCAIELYVGKLPWQDSDCPPDESDEYMDWLAAKKTPMLTNRKILLAGCPDEFILIFDLLKKTKFHQKPDYNGCEEAINSVRTRLKIKRDSVGLDWEPKYSSRTLTSTRKALPNSDAPAKQAKAAGKKITAQGQWPFGGGWLEQYFSSTAPVKTVDNA